jgi:site-specific DNA-methyltransferase (adenine-specific)
MFSSKTGQWETPQGLFDKLDEEFHFTLDPCADASNHKCDKYFTIEDNGLDQNWGGTQCFAILPMGIKKLVCGQRSVIKNL